MRTAAGRWNAANPERPARLLDIRDGPVRRRIRAHSFDNIAHPAPAFAAAFPHRSAGRVDRPACDAPRRRPLAKATSEPSALSRGEARRRRRSRAPLTGWRLGKQGWARGRRPHLSAGPTGAALSTRLGIVYAVTVSPFVVLRRALGWTPGPDTSTTELTPVAGWIVAAPPHKIQHLN